MNEKKPRRLRVPQRPSQPVNIEEQVAMLSARVEETERLVKRHQAATEAARIRLAESQAVLYYMLSCFRDLALIVASANSVSKDTLMEFFEGATVVLLKETINADLRAILSSDEFIALTQQYTLLMNNEPGPAGDYYDPEFNPDAD